LGCTFIFDRLAINGLGPDGDQPFVDDDAVVMCNGEIYNHAQLRDVVSVKPSGTSDCDIITRLLIELEDVKEAMALLDGVFGIVAHVSGRFIVARDPIGVRPVFVGKGKNGADFVSSEMKSLLPYCDEIHDFPPGHVMVDGIITSYYGDRIPYSIETTQSMLVASVRKRLMSDRPVGYFLSGGLDSSLISAIGAKYTTEPIKTFSIGIGDSPDLKYARVVADYIKSDHTEIRFTVEEGLAAIKDVIWALESYDCTTIRASVPMYIMSKYVRENTDIKVILSGEGADELFGGYLYFHYAPSHMEFQNETMKLLDRVHMHDIRRADRCTSAHGLELRVPFFDQALINYVKHVNPRLKVPSGDMEKRILRQAFSGWIPDEVLWRQKNGMSDAVGYSWVDAVRAHCKDLNLPNVCYDHNQPTSSEELYYRKVYHELFGKHDTLKKIWRPKWTNQLDPSAAQLDVFKQSQLTVSRQ
jgi:asparagine synthase (glutamine-hydrolysing)